MGLLATCAVKQAFDHPDTTASVRIPSSTTTGPSSRFSDRSRSGGEDGGSPLHPSVHSIGSQGSDPELSQLNRINSSGVHNSIRNVSQEMTNALDERDLWPTTLVPGGVDAEGREFQTTRALAGRGACHELPAYDPGALGALFEWEWDALAAEEASGGHSLYLVSRAVIEELGLTKPLGIREPELWKYLAHVEAAMPDNPYHNQAHVADVVHSMAYILTEGGLIDRMELTPLEIFAAIFAAAVHDFCHTGVTNDFLVRTADPLAVLFADSSVNERLHVAKAFQLLAEEECGVCGAHLHFHEDWEVGTYVEFRKLVLKLVLATDMAEHFAFVSKVKTKLHLGAAAFDPADERDKVLMLQLALKSADISHPTKTWAIAQGFTDNFVEECYAQGDLEEEYGMKVSPPNDRRTLDVGQSQVGFIDALVAPLYELLIEALPKMAPAGAGLTAARARWSRNATAPRPHDSARV